MAFLRRITTGVVSHFGMRVSEWAMIWPCAAMGFALNVQRDMFDTSPSFAKLAGWLDEPEWAFLALICAIVRLAFLDPGSQIGTEAMKQMKEIRHPRSGHGKTEMVIG